MAGKRRGPYALSDEERARRSALARRLVEEGRFGGRRIAVEAAERRRIERTAEDRAEEIRRVAIAAREKADEAERARRENPVIYRDVDGRVVDPPRRARPPTASAPSPWLIDPRPPS
jgi:hypothetical protein